MAIAGFILGLFGLFAWMIPLFGFPFTIAGLVFSCMGLSKMRGLSIAGIVINILFLVLTIANSAIGFYMGITGQLFGE